MKLILNITLLLIVLLLIAIASTFNNAEAHEFNNDIPKMYQELKGGTVSITAAAGGQGTGFFVQGQYIITNNHVVANKQDAKGNTIKQSYLLKVASGEVVSATVILRIKESDVAVLYTPNYTSGHTLELVEKDLTIGNRVMTIGNPLGLTGTLGIGIISNKNVQGRDTKNNILVSSEIIFGSSGSPVFNEAGKVIAVVRAVAGKAYENFGLAVPTIEFKTKVESGIITHRIGLQ